MSVTTRRLGLFLHRLTRRTDLLMTSYFVPFLAHLLTEGLDRRAKSRAAETRPHLPTPSYALMSADRPLVRMRPQGRRDDGKVVRFPRHFGRPGPLG